MLKRILEKPPAYSKAQMSSEAEKQLKYLSNAAQYDVLDHHKSTVGSKKSTP
jgi:hypothetical protein